LLDTQSSLQKGFMHLWHVWIVFHQEVIPRGMAHLYALKQPVVLSINL